MKRFRKVKLTLGAALVAVTGAFIAPKPASANIVQAYYKWCSFSGRYYTYASDYNATRASRLVRVMSGGSLIGSITSSALYPTIQTTAYGVPTLVEAWNTYNGGGYSAVAPYYAGPMSITC